ncbi:hypothetical protein KM043_011734 [Ampulex compressa]|nr:hypothetical protein KM043_011734 [Ampulex compressa]
MLELEEKRIELFYQARTVRGNICPAPKKQKMFSATTFSVLLGAFLLITTIPDAASYSKYGRSCKDIRCLSDQVCVMTEDACQSDLDTQCGRYPTCKKANTNEVSCASIVCGTNEYCKTVNGAATCVSKLNAPGKFSIIASLLLGIIAVEYVRLEASDMRPIGC